MAPPEAAVCTACVGEPAPEAAGAKAGQPSSLYEVPLTATGSGHRTEVAAGSFQVVLDAGRALGGQESGPSPVQAFVSSIVGCSQVRGDVGWMLSVFQQRGCGSVAATSAACLPLPPPLLPPVNTSPAPPPFCTSLQITLQLVAHDAGVQLGDISWVAHGVFDTRRLLGSSEADASPRFHSIAITGTVAADVPQSKLDELAGGC